MKLHLSNRSLKIALALGCGLAALLPVTRAQTLYGLSFSTATGNTGDQLLTINPVTGAGTLVGSGLGTIARGYGLGFRGSDLYTFNSVTDQIQQISTSTGLAGSGINIGVGNLQGEGDLTFRSDGIGFLSTVFKNGSATPSNDLFTFNLATNSSMLIGNTGSVSIDGLAFIGSTLYAVGAPAFTGYGLYMVNQTTAGLSLIGSLGVDMGSPFLGLSSRIGGGLFASIDDRLYTVNVGSGLATEVNSDPFVDIGYSSVSGLAQMNPNTPPPITPVPEPSTYGLMAGAGLLLAVFIRRKFAKK